MANQTKVQRLSEISDTVMSCADTSDLPKLVGAIEDALAVGPPIGDPVGIQDAADSLTKISVQADQVRGQVAQVATQHLPTVWLGTASLAANSVILAGAHSAEQTSDALHQANVTLAFLADRLKIAQTADGNGRQALEHAALLLRPHSAKGPRSRFVGEDLMSQALGLALDGTSSLFEAARLAEDAGRQVAGALSKYANQANAARLRSGDLTDADRLVITDAAVPSSTGPALTVLTADQTSRANARLDTLSGADQAQFNALLAGARSPQERAYLLGALAAGYHINDIATFDGRIHGHGDDPQWLASHLTPVRDTSLLDNNAQFGTQLPPVGSFDSHPPTATVVIAHAQVDPVYALYLSTGNHPGDPAFENGSAFQSRLDTESHKLFQDNVPTTLTQTMTDQQFTDAQNQSMSLSRNDQFRNVDLTGPNAMDNALPRIERTVDAGQPVTVTLGHSHEFLIVGHAGTLGTEGAMLQLYSPAGYTMWVDEIDFTLGAFPDLPGDQSSPGAPTSVRLP